jgi:hypothetical protein
MLGLNLVAAVKVLAEIDDRLRFQTPRDLMGISVSHPAGSSTGTRSTAAA